MPFSDQLTTEALTVILDEIPIPIFVKDGSSRFVGMNKACEEHWGISFGSIEGSDGSKYFPANQMDGFLTDDQKIFRARRPVALEERVWNNKLQQDRISHTFKTPLYDSSGNPFLLICALVDITEARAATEALKRSEAHLSHAQKLAKTGSWHLELATSKLEWSQAIFSIFEVDPNEFGGSYDAFLELCHPDDRSVIDEVYRASVKSKTPYTLEHRLMMPDGRIKWVEERGTTEYDAAGNPVRSMGTVSDITDHKNLEAAMESFSTRLMLLDGEEFYRGVVRLLTDLTNAEIGFICRTQADAPEKAEFLAIKDSGKFQANVPFNSLGTPCNDCAAAKFLSIPAGARMKYPESTFLNNNSIEAYSGATLFERGGEVWGVIGVMSRTPLDNIRTIENILRVFSVSVSAAIEREQSRRQYRDLFEFSPDGLLMVGQEGKIIHANKRCEEMFGWPPSALINKSVETLVPQDARQQHVSHRQKYNHGPSWRGMARGRGVLRGLRKDGSTFPAEIDLAPMVSDGKVVVAVAVRDITGRLAMEKSLAHAQKMDAIGQLTAGMAHDFNNYLGIIITNVEALKFRVQSDATLARFTDDALSGAFGASDMVHNLLAFARSQPLTPQLTEVNRLLRAAASLLKSAVGPGVDLTVEVAPDCWPVVIDTSQLECALINLANNARDAMPDGGKLTIVASNVRLDDEFGTDETTAAADYVLIEVCDTGVGMGADTISRIFDPFFSTKPTGSGTGLGLSMVYGFIKQSGGHIRVHSEVGLGTNIRLYIPRSNEPQKIAMCEPALHKPLTSPAWNKILVVEDNREMRTAVVEQLLSLGYEVSEAPSAEDALAILAEKRVDLLFTDIVMPGLMTGDELATIARTRYPNIQVLLTSGFAGSRWQRSSQEHLLKKPYTREELANALRRVLTSPRAKSN
jgi:PAS domain S-box-containing protein